MIGDILLLMLFIFILIPFVFVLLLGLLGKVAPEIMDVIINALERRLNRKK